MIEIDKTYKVEPTYKKSVEEIEIFENEDKTKFFSLSQTWRWGEYYVTPQNEEEVQWLTEGMTEAGICISDFEQWELDNTWDGVASEFNFWGKGWAEGEQEAFEEEYWEDYWEVIEKNGFESSDIEIYIHVPVTVTEVDPPWVG